MNRLFALGFWVSIFACISLGSCSKKNESGGTTSTSTGDTQTDSTTGTFSTVTTGTTDLSTTTTTDNTVTTTTTGPVVTTDSTTSTTSNPSDIPRLFREQYAHNPAMRFYRDIALMGAIGDHLDAGRDCPSGYTILRSFRDCKETKNVPAGGQQCKGLRNLCKLDQPIQDTFSPNVNVVYDFILSPLDALYYDSCPATHPRLVGSFARCNNPGEYCEGKRLLCLAKKELRQFAPGEEFLQHLHFTPWAETRSAPFCPTGYQWRSYEGEKHWFADNDAYNPPGFSSQGFNTECQKMRPVYTL
jgi:hypothetical protein